LKSNNLATVEEVFKPVGSGFATICKEGFVEFSKTVQVQLAPYPLASKSTGIFCAKEKVDPIISKAVMQFLFMLLFLYISIKVDIKC